MIDKLVIRSIDELWEQIVIEGLKNNAGRDYIHDSLVEAARKEIFDQMMFRMRVDDVNDAPRTKKNEEIVTNIMKNALKKWRSLIKRCDMYRETYGLIKDDDLDHIFDEEEAEEAEIPVETEEEDTEIDEMTSEWPELSEGDTDGDDFVAAKDPEEDEIVTSGYSRIVHEEIPVTPGASFPAGYWTR